MVWSEGSMRPSLSGAARCAHLSAKQRQVLPSRHSTSSLPVAGVYPSHAHVQRSTAQKGGVRRGEGAKRLAKTRVVRDLS